MLFICLKENQKEMKKITSLTRGITLKIYFQQSEKWPLFSSCLNRPFNLNTFQNMYLFHFHKHFSFQLYVVFSKSLHCHQFTLKDIITNTWRARSYSFSIIRRRYQAAICFWYFLTEISLARLSESFSVGNHYIAFSYCIVMWSLLFFFVE